MYGRVDWDDRIFGLVFVLSSAVSLGLLTVPGTSLFSDTILTLGSQPEAAEFSIAKIVSFLALIATIASNRTDWSKLTGVEYWTAITMIGLVVAPPFAPLLEGLLHSSVIAGGFAMVIQTGGFAIISYLG